MEYNIDELIKQKEAENIRVFDMSVTDKGEKYLIEEEMKIYKRRQSLMHDVLEEMDCTEIENIGMHNMKAHVPADYNAREYVYDVLNQCSVIFKVKDKNNIVVNLDSNNVTLIKAIGNLAIWRNNKNPVKKKNEPREALGN